MSLEFLQDVGTQFAEKAPRSIEHLGVYCALVLKRRLPHPAFCENHKSPLEAIWAAYSEQESFSIWHAMRGSGKTEDLAILAYLESVFKPRCGTTVLGGSLEQSQKVVAYLDVCWQNEGVPRHMLVNGQVAGRGYKLTNGSWVTALTASAKSVRGPHPQKLRLDEVDEMKPEIYNAALGQPKTNYGIADNIVASSTLHHPFGQMAEIIDQRHELGAAYFPWCIHEVEQPQGFWTKEELERKKKQLTTEMWESEYLLMRPSIGDTIYNYEYIEKAWERGRNDKWSINAKTEAGIDWGYGTTIMHVIQDMKERFTIPMTHKWELTELTERCEQISNICNEYQISVVYTDIAPKDSNITLNKIFRKNNTRTKIIPVAFNKFKATGIEVVRYLLENDIINITDKETKKKMQMYHYKNPEQEVIEKEDDHHPDALTAWAASKMSLLGD